MVKIILVVLIVTGTAAMTLSGVVLVVVLNAVIKLAVAMTTVESDSSSNNIRNRNSNQMVITQIIGKWCCKHPQPSFL